MKKHGKIEKAVLGDKNCAAIDWIKRSRKHENTILKCQDWRKTIAETNSHDTLTVFDPPWDDPKKSNYAKNAYNGHGTQYTPDIVKAAVKMKGTVVLLDRDTPEKRAQICTNPESPFKCHFIKVNGKGMMKKKEPWTEIVAIKKP